MDKFVIRGGNRLFGSTRLKGAKNSVLPLLSASLLTEEVVTICDCPNITDVDIMLKILAALGVNVKREGDKISTYGRITNTQIPEDLAREMRSSVFLLGSMLSVAGQAVTAHPGGCAIGSRPCDIHINGLRALGATVEERDNRIVCELPSKLGADGIERQSKLHGAHVFMEKVSVGATENLIMAAVLAEGRTVLRNAAREPEIVDLADMLNAMGARIVGAGTPVIEIYGVDGLHGVEWTPIPDRIVGGTLMVGVAMCGGSVDLYNCNLSHLEAVTAYLGDFSCNISTRYGIVNVSSEGAPAHIRALSTAPYPDFPTDMQAQFAAMLSIADGISLVCERVFENRFGYVPELRKFGADVNIVHDIAVIRGVEKLKGAKVRATDLRAGSAMVLAGLAAEGESEVLDVHYIDRGYEAFENTLSLLGADVKRVLVETETEAVKSEPETVPNEVEQGSVAQAVQN